ncbi:MAG: thymidylate synthase [Clostridia bacterium]|nr:thymidylate synthase [Clostridia bacterium]
MEYKNILDIKNRQDFRRWLERNEKTESECWVAVKRGKPVDETVFYYIDAVEEALCFGWIDSTTKEIDGKRMQRFSPRKQGSLWTELNKERVRRLIKLGLMTDAGRKVLPPLGKNSFQIDKGIEITMKNAGAWTTFKSFPPLYQRVRAYNVTFYKKRSPEAYEKALSHIIAETKKGKMFGEWNDYGRLLNYTDIE